MPHDFTLDNMISLRKIGLSMLNNYKDSEMCMHVKLNLMIFIKITRVDFKIIVILPWALFRFDVLRSNIGVVVITVIRRIFGSCARMIRWRLQKIIYIIIFLISFIDALLYSYLHWYIIHALRESRLWNTLLVVVIELTAWLIFMAAAAE